MSQAGVNSSYSPNKNNFFFDTNMEFYSNIIHGVNVMNTIRTKYNWRLKLETFKVINNYFNFKNKNSSAF